jgi:phasin family protein
MVEKTSKPTQAAPPKKAVATSVKPVAVSKAAALVAKPKPVAKPAPVAAKAETKAPEIKFSPTSPAPKPVETVKTETPTVAKPAPVAAKPAPVAPKIKPVPVAAAPIPEMVAPKPVEVAAPKVEPKAEAPAPKPTAKAVTKQQAAPVAALIEGSKTMNDTVTKVQDTAKKFTADAGQKMQAMFGDASERAKASYEKGVKMTEEFTEFQKGNVEAIVESGKLAAKAAESLGQEAADYARKSFESGAAAFKTFAGAKSPTELFKLQSDYMKSYFESAVAESTKVTEAWLKLAGDVAQPISNRMAVAVEKVKATAAF